MEKTSSSPRNSHENDIASDEAAVTGLDPFLELNTKSLSKLVLRKLLEASPCLFCGDRPRLARDPDPEDPVYLFGCRHLQIAARRMLDVFALWEAENPGNAASANAWVAKRRQKLNARMTIDAKFTADEWQIRGLARRPAKVVADALNRALGEALRLRLSREKSYAHVVATMRRHECGPDPLDLLQEMLDYIFPDTPKQSDDVIGTTLIDHGDIR
jgi:hypothetical protein